MAEEPEHPIQIKARGKKLVSKTRRLLDNIPQEFRAEAIIRIEEQIVPTETDINEPLLPEQVGSSIQRDNTTQSKKIDEFLDQDMPVTLTDSVITPTGQLGERTRTLDEGIQTLTPSPTQIEGKVENIGADRSIKETIVVDEVFPAALYAKERAAEILPVKFRVAFPTELERIDSAGEAAPPTLLPGDVARSSEQTKEGIKRDTVERRDMGGTGAILEGSVVTSQFGGTVAQVREQIVADGTQAQGGLRVIEDEVETLGDGTSIRRRVDMNEEEEEWPTLIAYEADARAKVVLKIEKKFVDADDVTEPTIAGLIQTEYKEYDRWKSIQIVTTAPTAVLGKTITRNITVHRQFPMQVDRCQYIAASKRTNFTVPGSGSIANEVSSFDIGLDISYVGGYSGIVEARIIETFTTFPLDTLPTIFKYYTVGGSLCLGYTMSGVAISGASVRTFVIKDSLHDVLDPTPPPIVNFAGGASVIGTITYSG